MQTIVTNSVCKKKWVYQKHDILKINHMINQFKISAISANVILNRLGDDLDLVNEFILSDLEKWLNKSIEIKDFISAAEIIMQAIDEGWNVCILGDYDVDGMLSSIMIDNFLRFFGLKTYIHIPNRLTEQYGPTCNGFDIAKRMNADLCLVLDCGSSAENALNYAANLGLRVVIIDHHMLNHIPKALAVVNPQRFDDPSPFKNMCTAGLVFLLIHGILQTDLVSRYRSLSGMFGIGESVDAEGLLSPFLSESFLLSSNIENLPKHSDEIYYPYLDLAAIATICDIMPLQKCNRALVKLGLRQINLGQISQPLYHLIKISGYNFDEITSEKIAFGVGPHINAAARLGKHELIIELFQTTDISKLASIVQEINSLNLQRRNIEKLLFEQIVTNINPEDPMVFAVGKNWHRGVLGTVASKLTKFTSKPSLVMSWVDHLIQNRNMNTISAVDKDSIIIDSLPSECFVNLGSELQNSLKCGNDSKEFIIGSGRSIAGINLGEIIQKALSAGILTCAGGHKLAVGFTLSPDKLSVFQDFVRDEIYKSQQEESMVLIDSIIDPISCNMRLWNDLQQLEPHGHQNHAPIFMISNVRVADMKVQEKCINCTLIGNSNAKIKGVLFMNSAQPELVDTLKNAAQQNLKVNCIGNFQMNFWQGRSNSNFFLKDIQSYNSNT